MIESAVAELLPASAWDGADLRGRQVLVVGAGGALGRACALDAAARGATVVLLGRNVRQLEKLYDQIDAAGGPQAAIYPLNLEGATPLDYAELGKRLIDECGRLDGLVNASGHLHGLTPIEHFEPEEWLRSFQVGLNAPFLLLKSLLPALRLSPAATALFFVDSAERHTRPYWGAYGIAQAALRALLAMTAAEWSNEPVRVLGLLPAPLASNFRRKAIVSEDAQRLADPARYAPLASWLLANAQPAWSGRVLDASILPVA